MVSAAEAERIHGSLHYVATISERLVATKVGRTSFVGLHL
jgi:hypothetical protein